MCNPQSPSFLTWWLKQRSIVFAQSNHGNISVLTALSIVPLMVFMGAGTDYGRVLSAQAGLQASIDSAALTLAQTGSSMSTAQLQAQATNLISSSYYNPATSGLDVSVTKSGSGAMSYQIKATLNFQPAMLGVLGYSTMPVSASATAQAKSTARNRIALVLDNSGSMADSGKIAALKGAANSFLTTLQGAISTSEDVYVSIVPFVDVVNVGTTNLNASWMDWTEWNNGSFNVSWNRSSSNGNRSTYWSGCVSDRGNISGPSNGNYDTNVTAPNASNTATLFPATFPAACPTAILPLTNDWTALSNKINAMTANGSTNQAIGLAHGWMSLVGGGPYPTPPAQDPAYQYQKSIIILSDGLNTYDRWYSWASQIDARQSITCANIKASGITLFSIQVNTASDPTSSILRTCASDDSKFYQISSASQMPAIFSNIAGQINQLTLTQ